MRYVLPISILAIIVGIALYIIYFRSKKSKTQLYVGTVFLVLGLGGFTIVLNRRYSILHHPGAMMLMGVVLSIAILVGYLLIDASTYCQNNQVYEKILKHCREICDVDMDYNPYYKKCVKTCQSGYTYKESDGYSCCVPPDCPTNQHYSMEICKCTRYYNDKDCAPCIKPTTGEHISQAIVNGKHCGVPSDDGTTCSYDPEESLSYERKMQNACISTPCEIKDPAAQCLAKGVSIKNFDGFDLTKNKCVVKSDCCLNEGDISGFNMSILGDDCKPTKQHNSDDYTCVEPTVNELENACIYDKNGCLYGYNWDAKGGMCISVNGGIDMSPANIESRCGSSNIPGGCRPSDKKYQWLGNSCFDASVTYDIKARVLSANTQKINVRVTMPVVSDESSVTFRYAILQDRKSVV